MAKAEALDRLLHEASGVAMRAERAVTVHRVLRPHLPAGTAYSMADQNGARELTVRRGTPRRPRMGTWRRLVLGRVGRRWGRRRWTAFWWSTRGQAGRGRQVRTVVASGLTAGKVTSGGGMVQPTPWVGGLVKRPARVQRSCCCLARRSGPRGRGAAGQRAPQRDVRQHPWAGLRGLPARRAWREQARCGGWRGCPWFLASPGAVVSHKASLTLCCPQTRRCLGCQSCSVLGSALGWGDY